MKANLFASKIIANSRSVYKAIISGLFVELCIVITYGSFFSPVATYNTFSARTNTKYENCDCGYLFHTTNI
jgi:hypothetical protein